MSSGISVTVEGTGDQLRVCGKHVKVLIRNRRKVLPWPSGIRTTFQRYLALHRLCPDMVSSMEMEDTQLRELARSIGFPDRFFGELAGNAWIEIRRRIVATLLYTLRTWMAHPHTILRGWLTELYDERYGGLRWQWHDDFRQRILSNKWVGSVPESIVDFGDHADGDTGDDLHGEDDAASTSFSSWLNQPNSRYERPLQDEDVETTDAAETRGGEGEEQEEQEDKQDDRVAEQEEDNVEDGITEPGFTPLLKPGLSHSQWNRWEKVDEEEQDLVVVGSGSQQLQNQQFQEQPQQEQLQYQQIEEQQPREDDEANIQGQAGDSSTKKADVVVRKRGRRPNKRQRKGKGKGKGEGRREKEEEKEEKEEEESEQKLTIKLTEGEGSSNKIRPALSLSLSLLEPESESPSSLEEQQHPVCLLNGRTRTRNEKIKEEDKLTRSILSISLAFNLNLTLILILSLHLSLKLIPRHPSWPNNNNNNNNNNSNNTSMPPQSQHRGYTSLLGFP
ncbi:hypothetical protein VM1G_10807 [Cytospora mali]|uniref:Uncharacterized protein n=1 Tax=Cytospora mali TaxID=578113 RepID=A0A194VJ87_CYTMA|nr:hypothetical protein VM1G_10807 [Valsa mali]